LKHLNTCSQSVVLPAVVAGGGRAGLAAGSGEHLPWPVAGLVHHWQALERPARPGRKQPGGGPQGGEGPCRPARQGAAYHQRTRCHGGAQSAKHLPHWRARAPGGAEQVTPGHHHPRPRRLGVLLITHSHARTRGHRDTRNACKHSPIHRHTQHPPCSLAFALQAALHPCCAAAYML